METINMLKALEDEITVIYLNEIKRRYISFK